MNPNRAALLFAAVVVALVVLDVGASLPAGAPDPGREAIGTLGVTGPGVSVNGTQVLSGVTIYSGDEISTGSATSAIVLFSDGGFFQIDQNTDPSFLTEAIEGVRCILVRFFDGQGYGDDTHTCIDTSATTAAMGSAVNVRVTRQQTVLTLLRGQLVVTRPRRADLRPGDEVTAEAGRSTITVRPLSPAQLRERTAWRAPYRFLGWCRDERGEARNSFLDECERERFSFLPPPRGNVPFETAPWPVGPLPLIQPPSNPTGRARNPPVYKSDK